MFSVFLTFCFKNLRTWFIYIYNLYMIRCHGFVEVSRDEVFSDRNLHTVFSLCNQCFCWDHIEVPVHWWMPMLLASSSLAQRVSVRCWVNVLFDSDPWKEIIMFEVRTYPILIKPMSRNETCFRSWSWSNNKILIHVAQHFMSQTSRFGKQRRQAATTGSSRWKLAQVVERIAWPQNSLRAAWWLKTFETFWKWTNVGWSGKGTAWTHERKIRKLFRQVEIVGKHAYNDVRYTYTYFILLQVHSRWHVFLNCAIYCGHTPAEKMALRHLLGQ